MRPKLIILVGPPCSGKSTWAVAYCKQHVNTVRINRDDIRKMLRGKIILDQAMENIVTVGVMSMIKQSLKSGHDVIIDQTNCRYRYIFSFFKEFGDIATINFKVLEAELPELRKRNQIRAIETKMPPIPDHVIERMYTWQQELLKSIDFKNLMENRTIN